LDGRILKTKKIGIMDGLSFYFTNCYFSSKIIPVIVTDIVQIENIALGREIVQTRFACDLKKCKGACCTIESDYGAPLLDEEIETISKILEIVKEYLPEKHKHIINKKGFFEKKDNKLMTTSVENRACVFVNYENGIAKCGIEKAYFDGKTDFRKPISCHLFPIRVEDFGGDVLRYEKFEECSPALKKGKKENINLVNFLEESLIRKFGKKWFTKLKGFTDKINAIT
jgi:Fe-S-cluster containining protein